MNAPAAIFGPVDELPPEGADLDRDAAASSSDSAGTGGFNRLASAFAESRLGFALDREGIHPLYPVSAPQVSQRVSENSAADELHWDEEAYEIDLSQALAGPTPFQHFSDLSEPEDYVRRFLRILTSSLDEPVFADRGRPCPIVRWKPADEDSGATVQVLGFFLADEEFFQSLGDGESEDFGFVFEDPEVTAHGLREFAVAAAVVGLTLSFTTNAEAGLFQKWKEKRQARMEQASQQRVVREVQAPISASRTQARSQSWQDVHRDARIDHELLAAKPDAPRRIVVDIENQRAYLLVDGEIAVDTAVSTARSGKHTPRGEFQITQKVRTGKISTIYDVPLPYWMRLDQTAIGMHVGDLPGYPASAGCIRLPQDVAPVLFDHASSGVTVQVVDSWTPLQRKGQGGERDVLLADTSEPEDAS